MASHAINTVVGDGLNKTPLCVQCALENIDLALKLAVLTDGIRFLCITWAKKTSYGKNHMCSLIAIIVIFSFIDAGQSFCSEFFMNMN
jgi:hypothetical protein